MDHTDCPGTINTLKTILIFSSYALIYSAGPAYTNFRGANSTLKTTFIFSLYALIPKTNIFANTMLKGNEETVWIFWSVRDLKTRPIPSAKYHKRPNVNWPSTGKDVAETWCQYWAITEMITKGRTWQPRIGHLHLPVTGCQYTGKLRPAE